MRRTKPPVGWEKAKNCFPVPNELLEHQSLVVTERTEIITKRGIKKTGNLLYTIVPMHEVMSERYERQLRELELTTERQRVQKKLAEQASA